MFLYTSLRLSGASGLLAAVLALSPVAAPAVPTTADVPTVRIGLQAHAQTYASEATIEAIRQATVAAQVQGRVLEARVDADRMLIATQSALDSDGDVLSASERADIDALMAALATQRDCDDAAVIEAATQALAKGTEAFAAQRMNRGIRQALAGKNVQTL